jgi:hypothetical protein
MKKWLIYPKMINLVDHLLSKICLAVPKARRPTPRSISSLVKLDRYCSDLDHLSCMDLVNSIMKIPFSIKYLHFWTESLLRVCDLYDQRDDHSRREYFQRLKRHTEVIWNVYKRVTSDFDRWHCIYMYVTMEFFLFQIKWKKAGLEPVSIVPTIKPILEILKYNIDPDANLYLPYSYATDFIFPETFHYFD